MSAARRKGTSWEVACVELLGQTFGPEVERRALAGVNDRGDVAGIPGVVVECKNEKSLDLAGYVTELEGEITNAKAKTGVVFAKRRMKGTKEGYAILPIWRYIELLESARRLDS